MANLLSTSSPRKPLIYFLSQDLPLLDISDKKNHPLMWFLLSGFFTYHNIFEVHSPSSCFSIWFLFVVSGGYYMNIAHFGIHLPADGHKGYVQFGLLQIMLQCTFPCESVCGHALSVLLDN